MKKKKKLSILLAVLMVLSTLGIPMSSYAATSSAKLILKAPTTVTAGSTVNLDIYIDNTTTTADTSGVCSVKASIIYDANSFSIPLGLTSTAIQKGADAPSEWKIGQFQQTPGVTTPGYLTLIVQDNDFTANVKTTNAEKHVVRLTFTAASNIASGSYAFKINQGKVETGLTTCIANLFGGDGTTPANYSLNFTDATTTAVVNHTVSYDANGGSGTMTDSNGAEESDITLSANTFTRAFYTFAGWSTTADGAVEYADGASYTIPSSNSTLYAVWEPSEITFNDGTLPNGAKGGTYSTTVAASGGSGSYSYALSSGNLPSGLTLGSDGVISGTPGETGSFVVDITATDTETDQTATATFDMTVKVAAPVASIPSGAVSSGTTFTLSCQTAGASIYYTTDGTDPNVDNVYKVAEDTVPVVEVVTTEEGNIYTVEEDTSPSVTSLAAAASDGTTFLYAGETITISSAMTLKAYAAQTGETDSDIATYTYTIASSGGGSGGGGGGGSSSSTHSLSYNGNGYTGGIVPASASYATGTVAEVAGNSGSLVKTGYTFAGWNTKADGSGTTYDEGDSITMSASVTLYALWEEAGAMISYDAADWGAASADDYVIAYDTATGTIIPTSYYDSGTGSILYIGDADGTVGGKYNFVTFSDVDESLWSSGYIWFNSARDVINGMGDGTFAPENNVTRAQFVKLLGAMTPELDITGYTGTSFNDVASDAWYAGYINWANKNGIVSGYGDGIFGPNDQITREQMCVMMQNYAKYLGYGFDAIDEQTGFSDQGQISSWADDAVDSLQTAGFITGKGDNLFDPTGMTTRGETATIICKFIRSIVSAEETPASIPWEQ